MAQLQRIQGMTDRKCEAYGPAILALIESFSAKTGLDSVAVSAAKAAEPAAAQAAATSVVPQPPVGDFRDVMALR